MIIFDNQLMLSKHIKSISNKKTTIGFVPTMGALHVGHLSLIRQSLKANDVNIVSIFVNPTQFNNHEDLSKYPRTLQADIEKIKSVSSDIIVYTPTTDDIYHGKTESQQFDFDGLENQMEGQFRIGHFNGVGTIIQKLFKIIQPTNAYFGEKDFQQLQIIKKLVEKFKLPVNIVCCPIYRENNGLAMSSRNERLTKIEREKAALIYKTLKKAAEMYKVTLFPVTKIRDFVTLTFRKNPDFKLEYFDIADEETLTSINRKNKTKNYRAFIAVFLNNIRLIDTISLK